MIGIEARLLGGLAAVAVALFAWHRIAEGLREEGRNECRSAAVAEFKENSDDLTRIAAKARAAQPAREAAAADARAAADRLRGAVAGAGLVVRPAAAPGSAPAAYSEGVSDQLLAGVDRLVERANRLAEIADERGARGSTCEASYDALGR